MSLARFNLIQPKLEPVELSARYRTFVNMTKFVEQHDFAIITLEEHHKTENGWSPSPLTITYMVFARTKTIKISISALLMPQHHPIRLTENIAVADLLSDNNHLSIVTNLNYRPSKYHLLDKK